MIDFLTICLGGLAGGAVSAVERRIPRKHKLTVPPRSGEVNEFLRWNGESFVPFSPPQFVAEGVNPVKACWDRFHAEGVRYDSRRVGEPT